MINDLIHIWPFIALLPFVAFLYASVGHGGASGYLALMGIFSFATNIMKPTALLLNLFVAAAAFYHYYKQGHFNKTLFISFAGASIPMAYIGGLLTINAELYKKVLAVLLIFAILKLLNVFGKESSVIKTVKTWQGIIVGGAIGFFSGLIGIGGGIILSPVILLLHWGKMKEAAAVSALFIWVNSAAGLAGQFSTGVTLSIQSVVLVLIALCGGFLGAYVGSKKLNNTYLKHMLAFVLAIASIKLFLI
ncbi:MAG: sulfite exporter TauE/SafE family protein [Flavobacteriaceae bacterium]